MAYITGKGWETATIGDCCNMSGLDGTTLDVSLNKLVLYSDLESYNCWPKSPSTTGTSYASNQVVIKDDIIEMPAIRFKALGGGVTLSLSSLSRNQTVQYCTSVNGTWLTLSTNMVLNIAQGNSVYIRGNLSGPNSALSNYTTTFATTGNVELSGNMSYFWNYTTPSTALKNYCGYKLFQGCSSITDCSKLVLPATTLNDQCYERMFQNCSSITKAPVLPAPALVTGCYDNLFTGCTNLSYIKCLATSGFATLISSRTSDWVSGVASSGTFVKSSSVTESDWGGRGASAIPTGWTVVSA